MTFVSLAELLFPVGICLFLLTTVSLGGGLLLSFLLRKRADAVTETLILRATLCATAFGILLSLVPLPRLQLMPLPTAALSPVKSAPQPAPIPTSAEGTARPTTAREAPTPLGVNIPALLVGLWLFGTGLLVGRLTAGYGYVARLGRRAPTLSPFTPLGGLCTQAFAAAPRPPKKVVMVESADLFLVDLPLLPVFLALPQDAETRFDRAALDAVLAHERSHLERRDGWWNLAAQLLCCLLPFQPLAWFLLRAMERNSETASDEAALNRSECNPRAYAETLLRFAESPQDRRLQTVRGVSSLVTRSSLEERIRTVMNRSPLSARLAASPRLRAAAVGSLSALALVSAFTFGVRSKDASAQPMPQQVQAEKLVSVEAQDAPVVQIVNEVLKQVGLRLADEDRPILADSRMTISMKTSPFPQALNMVLRSVPSKGKRLHYRIEGKTVRIIPIPLDKNNLPLQRVSLEYGPGSLRGALEAMLEGTGIKVDMNDTIPLGRKINLQNTPISEAIPALLKSHPDSLVWSASWDYLRVQTGAEVRRLNDDAQRRTEEALKMPVTLNLTNAPLSQAVGELLHAARIGNFSIDNLVGGVVTLSIKDKPAREALEELLKQSEKPMEMTIKDGVVTIAPKP